MPGDRRAWLAKAARYGPVADLLSRLCLCRPACIENLYIQFGRAVEAIYLYLDITNVQRATSCHTLHDVTRADKHGAHSKILSSVRSSSCGAKAGFLMACLGYV